MKNNIEILGFKTYINSVDDILDEINKLSYDNESVIQLLDADGIAGKEHIIHSVNQSLLAFDRGENLANDLSVEICLRCSAQRQISKAFKLLGLKSGNCNICAVLLNCSRDINDKLNNMFERDDAVLSPNIPILKEIYGISDKELESIYIQDIIIDKVTKLVVDY